MFGWVSGSFGGSVGDGGYSFYSGRLPLGARGGVVSAGPAGEEGGGRMLDNFLRALYADSVIDYNGHGYHMKDDPDGNFFIVLPNGDEVFASDLSSYYYADADGMGQAKLIFFGCCNLFRKGEFDAKSVGDTCVDKGAQAVVAYDHTVARAAHTWLRERIYYLLTQDGRTVSYAVARAKQEWTAQHGLRKARKWGVTGLLAKPEGTSSRLAPAPESCQPEVNPI